MVKAVTMAFCGIQWHFLREARAKFGIPNLSQSPDTGHNSDSGISDFRVSGQSLIKGNCHNSGTSDNIDMKLGPVTKLNKGNKKTSKNFDNEVILENCDVIAIFLIYGQFGTIFINSNLLSYKNLKQN